MRAAILYTGGLNHPTAAILPAWRALLGEAGFTITASEDLDEVAAALTAAPQALLVVHALRWTMTQHEKYAPDRARWAMEPSVAARAALATHVRRGGGLLALHTASICFDTWPEWPALLGGSWQWGQSFHPPYGRARATLDATHFLARDLPAFALHDEVYTQLAIRPGAKVFGWAQCLDGADRPAPSPVMWTWEGSGGRVVYDALGHDGGSMNEPTHRQLIQRAALWRPSMREIDGMSVLVTGGGSGIGAGIARHFVARGARVTITGRRADKLQALAQSLGPACHTVTGDVTVETDRAAMLAAAVAHGGRLDVLVNNAGNMYRQAVGEYTEAALREAFDTNVIAGMMLASAAVPLLAANRGAIVFMGSVHTRRAYPGATPYAATKAAVEGLTRVMAAELGPRKIRVCCVVPGAVPSELNVRAGFGTPEDAAERYARLAVSHVLGRVGTSAEIAEAVEYLARAEWVTGAVLEVDGGLGLAAS